MQALTHRKEKCLLIMNYNDIIIPIIKLVSIHILIITTPIFSHHTQIPFLQEVLL